MAIFSVAAGMAHAQTAEPVIAVAVIDVGTDSTSINLAGGFNFVLGNQDLSDLSATNHGTTVSLIVDQEAPGIPQFQYIASNGQFESSTGLTDAALLTAAANPDVRTIALSSSVGFAPSSVMADASNASKLISIRAGNDGNDNPNTLSIASFQLPGVVIVAASDGSGGTLPTSNNCGVTAPRCVRTIGTTEFNPLAGTSFASARLAGIAAEVLRSAPFLSGEQLAQVIFATAEDLGDPGVDPVYGNGFVRNAAQVINNPAGPTQIPTGDGGGGGGAVVAGGLVLAAAVGAAVLYNKKDDGKLKRTLVLDTFGRPFEIDLTQVATIDDSRRSVADYLDALDRRSASQSLLLGRGLTAHIGYLSREADALDVNRHFALDGDSAFDGEELDVAISLHDSDRLGFNYAINYNRDPAFDYGALPRLGDMQWGGHVSFLSGQNFSTPLLSFAGAADSAAIGFTGRNGLDVRFGLVNTDEDLQYGRKSVAAVLEGAFEFAGRGLISAQFGQLQESGSLFGGSSGGALGVDTSETYAISLSGSWRVNDRLSVIGNYGIGYTDVQEHRDSLLSGFSSLRSNWFGLGLIGRELLSGRDQWGVALSQPLRVSHGEVDREVPYARDFNGNIYKHRDRINLRPDGTEYTLESFYRYPLSRESSLGAHLIIQHEPNHVADSDTEITVLGSLRTRF